MDRVRFSHLSEENNKHTGNDYQYKQKSASNLDLSISRKAVDDNLIYNKIRPSKSLECNTQQNNYNNSDLPWKCKENYEDLNSIAYSKF